MTDEQRYIYDLIGASAERTVKRLWVLIILLIMALLSTNAGWLWYECQYEDTVITQDVDTGDGDAVMSGTGDINYGKDKTDSENP